MQKTYTLTELKENKELLLEFKTKVKAEGIRTPYWNLSEDKFRSMYSSVMYMAEFAEKIESGQSDIEEVIETEVKKKPDTGNGKLIKPKCNKFGEFQEYNFGMANRFETFCKNFQNKMFRSGTELIDTRKKQAWFDGELIYQG